MALVLLLVPPAGAGTSDGVAALDVPSAAPLVAQAPGIEPFPPHQTRAAVDVTITLVDVMSDYGPETYKSDDLFNTRNPQDVENQTTNWDNALGHRITFRFDIEGNGYDLQCDDRFVAETYIKLDAAGNDRLDGWTNGTFRTTPPSPTDACLSGLPGVRTYWATFDLDGVPPTVAPANNPALGTGVWAVAFDLYHAPATTDPTGRGPLAGQFELTFSMVEPGLTFDVPFGTFPESALRLFSDLGATLADPDAFYMFAQPMNLTAEHNLTIDLAGVPTTARFQRIDHFAARIPPGASIPVKPPGGITAADALKEKLENTDDRAPIVAVQRREPSLSNDSVPESRLVQMIVAAANFSTLRSETVGDYHPLHVVTIHIPADLDNLVTGASSFVAAFSDRTFPVRDMSADAGLQGVGGETRITLQDNAQVSGGTTGNNAGDLFALRLVGTEVVAEGRLSRESGTRWVRGDLPHASFADPIGAYDLLAMLYGPSDEFLGMSQARRGIEVEAGALRMVEGKSASIPLTVRNLNTDFDDIPGEADYTLTVQLRSNANFPDGTAYNQTVSNLGEGQSTTIDVPVLGSVPGEFTILFTAQSVELVDETQTTVVVISKEQAREENRKWYQIPGPGALLTAVALVAVLAAVRRRPLDRAP